MPWVKFVSFKQNIHECGFIICLLCRGKLSQKDRFNDRRMNVNYACYDVIKFMNLSLIFSCLSPSQLSFEILWALDNHHKGNFKHPIYKFSLAAAVYNIWRARKEVPDILNAVENDMMSNVSSHGEW